MHDSATHYASRPPQPEPEPGTLAARVRTALGDRSAAEIAKRAGISRVHLHRIATGRMKCGPSVDVVRSLAEALGVTPAWLGFGEVAGE